MLGSVLVKFAFLSSLAAAGLYYYTFRKNDHRFLHLARYSYHAVTISVMSFCAFLVYLILTHQFQYTYVWNYSSTDLPTPLLISTFYAGQEGSFSLWALYTALLGVFLMQYTSRKGYENETMFVWSLILTFLLGMLIIKNPFEMIWNTFPKDLIQSGPIPPNVTNFIWIDEVKKVWAQIPVEGRGLNPLLQNYWMVIHPQILFTGFTSMAVPYAYAIAGMLKKDYQGWVKIAKPWTVFAALALGTGIILGGYWAYETLGWGGYWGWDPVENSSLIPWLICIASIHTMMAQRRSGTFVRTNIVLSLLCFLTVLYSTFLTRSGVLGDTSVHSFVDAGMWAYWMLLGAIIVFALFGFVLLLMRMREFPKIPVEHSVYSREFALFIGAFMICFAAFFITIGTSSPIITQIAKGRAAAVDIAYYVKTTLPLGIGVALFMGIGQLLWWQRSDARSLLRSLRYPVIASTIMTGALAFAGVTDIPVAIFTFASSFALFVNVMVGYTIYRGNPRYAGGAIAHIGIALMFLGFVASAKYDERQTVSLEAGKPIEALDGYTLTYVGNYPIDEERYGFRIDVERGDQRFSVTPVMRYSKFTNGLLRHPDIVNMLTKDFYVSPLSVETPDNGKQNVSFLKGETKDVGGASVTFVDFDFSDVEKGKMLEQGEFSIGVMLDVTKDGSTERIRPEMKNSGGSVSYVPAKSTLTGLEIVIARMQPNREDKSKSTVELTIAHPNQGDEEPKGEALIVEASVKPYINLVWMGTVTLLVGFLLTIVRRVQEARA